MKKSYDLDLFYTMLISKFDELEEDTDFPVYFYQGLYDGTNQLKHVETTETKKFNDHWIFAIESYYPYIDKIIRNYKSALRVEEEVVIVEKAKKTTSRTVRHLAANTHLLKLPEDGQPMNEVRPKKLLVEYSEDEFGIYENRFVATLVHRLVDFVSKRVQILEEDVNSKRINELNNKIELQIDNSQYEINIDLKETQTIEEGKIEEDNKKLLERALELHKKLANALNSDFIKTMKSYKRVRSPIMKTQIILKNTNYRNCYLLWQYLDQYNSLGFELIRDVKQKRFNEIYRKHLSQNALMAFSTMMFHDRIRESDQKLLTKSFKVKKAQEIKLTADDLKIDPEAHKIEDTMMNEYYLNKSKQIFKKTIDQYMQTEPRYDVALRKALKDTIEITNGLYASYFEINQDEDVFNRLIQETNPKDDLHSSDKKFKIASLVRQIKEQDYKKAVALEKKWYNTTLRYQKRFFKSVKLDSDEKLKKEAQKVRELNEQYTKLERAEMLDEQRVRIAKDNQMLLELKTKYRERYKKEAKRIADMQKRKAERELERLRKRREAAKEKLRISKEKQRAKQKIYIEKQKQKIKASHDKAMESLKKGK